MARIVNILIRMRYAAMRHRMHGVNLAAYIIAGVLGLLVALGTDLLALGHSATAVNLLASMLAFWWIGWVSGSILMGTETTLSPRYFAHVPVTLRKLMPALLIASCAGMTTLITSISFLAYVFYGTRFGTIPALVGLLATLLEVVFVILCARCITALLSATAQSRLKLELTAIVIGMVFGLCSSGWVLFLIFKPLTHLLARHTTTLYADLLPTTWGMAAVRTAARHQWFNVACLLGGLLALSLLFLGSWLYVERRKMVVLTSAGSVAREHRSLWVHLLHTGVLRAIADKELAMWSRDVWRARLVRTGLWMGFFICGLPALGHFYSMLPWTGMLVILMGVVPGANIYAYDGSSLWLTMMTPQHFSDDIRARQYAWLVTVAPLAVLLSLSGTYLAGKVSILPWVLTVLFAGIGSASGIATYFSVYWLVPVTEQRKRGGSAIVTGPDMGKLVIQMRVAILLVTAVTAIPLAVVAVGTICHSPIFIWSGVALGGVVGILVSRLGPHYASRRLQSHAPELFAHMVHAS